MVLPPSPPRLVALFCHMVLSAADPDLAAQAGASAPGSGRSASDSSSDAAGALLPLSPVAQFNIQRFTIEHLDQRTTADGVTLLAIDISRPRFSWHLVPTNVSTRGLVQVAYQLQLQSTGGADTSVSLWDSGRVASNNSVFVRYPSTAPVLTSDSRYTLRLTAWGVDGGSANASTAFSTGLFRPSDWSPVRVPALRVLGPPYIQDCPRLTRCLACRVMWRRLSGLRLGTRRSSHAHEIDCARRSTSPPPWIMRTCC